MDLALRAHGVDLLRGVDRAAPREAEHLDGICRHKDVLDDAEVGDPTSRPGLRLDEDEDIAARRLPRAGMGDVDLGDGVPTRFRKPSEK